MLCIVGYRVQKGNGSTFIRVGSRVVIQESPTPGQITTTSTFLKYVDLLYIRLAIIASSTCMRMTVGRCGYMCQRKCNVY